jgi:hypothetical protein
VNLGKTLFAEVMEFVPWTTFTRIVHRYGGNSGTRTLTCAEQLRAMAFAQLPSRASLAADASKLYAMVFRSPVKRSTLADANESRDWRSWSDLPAVLIHRARKLFAGHTLNVGLGNTVYALDSSTDDLCLSPFEWVPVRSNKAAIMLQPLMDLRGAIPAFIHISDGKLHDVNVLYMLKLEAGAFYAMDRGCVDFERLYALNQAGAFFVTRAKSPTDARRVYSAPTERGTGVICDQRVMLNGYYSARKYPVHLRCIRFKDPESGKTLVLLTNNTTLPALTIAALYKSCWQVELFFKWIKQHLRMKKFLGTSENTVRKQICYAVSTYVLIAIVKKELHLNSSLYTCLQILLVYAFKKTEISCALQATDSAIDLPTSANQLDLLDI